MGLFRNNKKLCPICGEATPRFFSTKVEEMPICKECANKIFLPDGVLEGFSLDDLEEYMNFYEQNQVLRDKFNCTYQFDVGNSGMSICMDHVNGLFRLKNNPNALVFEVSCIETYRILEDNEPLFQGNKKAIKFFESTVPERARELEPMISQFKTEKREYERLERMEEMMERREDVRNRNFEHDCQRNHSSNYNYNYNSRPRPYHPRPTFDAQEPFRNFSIRVRMEHPYWKGIHRGNVAGPSFDNYSPSVINYLREYEQTVKELHELALNFKKLVNPKSKEIYAAEQVEPTKTASVAKATVQEKPTIDSVEEIKRFKGLLDAGIITEEEFTAKKKQLLGI